MSEQIFGPILPLLLDPRNGTEIVRSIQSRIFIESEGKLTDFTPASPLAAISEGQAFAQSELQYYLNSLPEALTVEWLRSLGIQRRIGTRATARVTFGRIPGNPRAITIPAGTKLFANGGQVYILQSQVIIGESTSIGTVVSERWGEVYNVPANQITRIERNYIGLGFLTNLAPATGGRDLETVDEMKVRAFELLGRRNLTSRRDFDLEVRNSAPEAEIVSVLPYDERFSDSSRGVFIVAGGFDGSRLSVGSQTALLESLRDRIPLDVKVYVTAPKVLPVDVLLNVTWDPNNSNLFTDNAAEVLYQTLQNTINPLSVGLGNPLSFTTVNREILGLEFVEDILNLDIREMALDPEITGATDGVCGRFLGEELGSECLYTYNKILDKVNQGSFETPDPISTYRLFRTTVALTSIGDFSTLTYKYENLYEII